MDPFALSLACPEPVEAAKGWFDKLTTNGVITTNGVTG